MASILDTPTSAAATPHSFTVSAGTNRALIVGVTQEGTTLGAPTVTYGGQSMVNVVDLEINPGTTSQRATIFFLNNAGIVAASGTSIVVSNAVTTMSIHAASYENCVQTTPTNTDTDSSTAATPNPLAACDIVTGAANAVVVAVAGMGNDGTAAWAAPLTERTEQSMATTATGSLADDEVATATTVACECTWTTQNRAVICALEIVHLAAEGITSIDPTTFDMDNADIDINGVNFLATQGTGTVYISDADTLAGSVNEVEIANGINTWSDTVVNLDLTGLNQTEIDNLNTLGPGTRYIILVNNDSDEYGSTAITLHRAEAFVMSLGAGTPGATTARLTAPATKTTGDFDAGRFEEAANPATAVNITADNYTEMVWSIEAKPLSREVSYDFRVTKSGVVLDTYSVTPQLTISVGYTMTAESGSYSLTGTAVDTLKNSLVTATSGSLNLTGTLADLLRGYTIDADSDSYALTGQDVDLPVAYKLTAESGSYAKTGTDAGLQRGYYLEAESGDYEYAGVSFGSNVVTNPDFESYTGTQDDATTDAFTDWTVNAGTGLIEATATVQSGSNAVKITWVSGSTSIVKDIVGVVTPGWYRLGFWCRGNDDASELVILVYADSDGVLVGQQGTGVYGTDYVYKEYDFEVLTNNNTYVNVYFMPSATGGDVVYVDNVSIKRHTDFTNLYYNRLTDAESGSYAKTGTAVDLYRGHYLEAESGSYAKTGTDAGLNRGYTLEAELGSYVHTGTAVSLKRGHRLDAESGSYSITSDVVYIEKDSQGRPGLGGMVLAEDASNAYVSHQWVAGSSYTLKRITLLVGPYFGSSHTYTVEIRNHDGTNPTNVLATSSFGEILVLGEIDLEFDPGCSIVESNNYCVVIHRDGAFEFGNAGVAYRNSTGSDLYQRDEDDLGTWTLGDASSELYLDTYERVSQDSTNLYYNRLIDAESGSYAQTGQDVELDHVVGYSLDAESGSYAYEGDTITQLLYDRVIDAESGVYGTKDLLYGLGDCATDFFDVVDPSWSHNGGTEKYDCDGSQVTASNLVEYAVVEVGKFYKIQFTISNYVAGNIRIQSPFDTSPDLQTANGTYTFYGTSGVDRVTFRTNADFQGSIDDIIVEEAFEADLRYNRFAEAESGEYGTIDLLYGLGDCATDFIDFSGTGWSHNGSTEKYDCDGSQTAASDLIEYSLFDVGKFYKVQFSISNYSTGNFRLSQPFSSIPDTGDGDYVYYGEATVVDLRIRGSVDFVGSVDNIIVEEFFVADLYYNRLIEAESGVYTQVGQAVTLVKTGAYELLAEAGAYAKTGTDVGLRHNYTLECESGSYAQTGIDATLTYTPISAYFIDAESGSFSLTGTDTDLLRGYPFIAENGSYVSSGTVVDLLRGLLLDIEAGSYAATGQAVELLRNYFVTATSGSLALTGTDIDFIRGLRIGIDSGHYSQVGRNVALLYSEDLPPTISKRLLLLGVAK